MTVTADSIASLVQQEYEKLPAKRKPVIRDNGLREWVPLSGIVAEGKDGKLTCLSLATGMKCLPSNKLPLAQGNVLHDWHAETLAIRAFNRFVLDECQALANGSRNTSEFIRCRSSAEMVSTLDSTERHDNDSFWHGQPFAWREEVLLHMYCSEAPCGDASMELTMASQADATPWAIPQASHASDPTSPELTSPLPSNVLSSPVSESDSILPGRGYFSQLGIVRRKPSRADAPPALSKSCSDKLALRQCTSLLSSLTSLFVCPANAYIATLVLPTSQFSASGCRRAFSGGKAEGGQEGQDTQAPQARMCPLANRIWGAGYAFHPFEIKTTDLEFAFSRRSHVSTTVSPSSSAAITPPTTGTNLTPCNLSVARTHSGLEETTLNGVLQGRKASEAHVRGASFVSRRRVWGLAVEIAGLLDQNSYMQSRGDIQSIQTLLGGVGLAYGEVKNAGLLEVRRWVKEDARREALKGWIRNSGDEDFVL
ncbi:adenosine deaminase/editase [Xylariaceae sp. FL1651]|nr:adenosine deaminase/editase [Xylariaceae sp. FL1651]